MTTAITAIGGMFCGFLSNHIDISPNFAGTLMGITNTVATIPGIAVPFVVNVLTTHDVSLFVNLLDSFLVEGVNDKKLSGSTTIQILILL